MILRVMEEHMHGKFGDDISVLSDERSGVSILENLD